VKKYAVVIIFCLLMPVVGCADGGNSAPQPLPSSYYPSSGEWEKRSVEQLGFSKEALDKAVAYALANESDIPVDLSQAVGGLASDFPDRELVGPFKERGGPNGLLVRNGYIVAEWGDTERVDMTFSATKSYLSLTAGLAWDKGLIPDLDEPVGLLVRDGGFDSEHNQKITWRHLLQQTSEWQGTLFGKNDRADRRRGVNRELQAPGSFYEYNDVRVNRTALSLLRVWGQNLPSILKTYIMDPIGASDAWEWHGYTTSWVEEGGKKIQSVSGGGHWGGGMFINSRDHARMGYLMLRDGVWNDQQLISKEWIKASTTPSWQKPQYGFMWWLNTSEELLPGAPANSYMAAGLKGNAIVWVDPEHDLVLVSRWLNLTEVQELVRLILGALVEEN